MKILIVDDNKTISGNISLFLRAKGYDTKVAHDGDIAFDMIRSGSYDFLIVDRMMPVIDGLALIRMLQARSIHIPFLFLTALSKQTDKIEWLSLGADDYLVKPFDLEELRLRIENIMRRNGKQILSSSWFAFGPITLDAEAKSVKKNDKHVDLSPKEYALLEILIKNQWRILSRDELYEEVWGDYEVSESVLDTVNVHIAHLRKKLTPDLIRTVKLSGYVIDKN